jgi:hypothetical protein
MTDQPTAAVSTGIILLPSDRFFVRTVPLAAEAAVGPQVELALENLAPFPVGQLYYGYWLSPARDSALVFAAYRKRFTPDETAAWSGAAAVLPAFFALLGAPPASPVIRVWTEAGSLTVAAWNGRQPQPVAVLTRQTAPSADAAQRAAVVAEIRGRTGLADTAVQEFSGTATVSRNRSRETFELKLPGGPGLSLGAAELRTADVRDKEFLGGQRATQKRDLLLWRGFLAGAIGLAAMVVLEAGLLAGRLGLQRLKDAVQQQAPLAQKIETAQSLSVRIEEMTQRRLRPFEMLALINQNRPASISFVRTTTTGLYSLEIEAQTANAADVSQYEAVLRAAPELAGIETRDLRSREGQTSFILTVTFKPDALRSEGGS